MTILEDVLTVLEGSSEEKVLSFEAIIAEIPYIHGSNAQMMAVYRSFKQAIDQGYIVRVNDPTKKRMFVNREYYRTDKVYEKKKKTKVNKEEVDLNL